MKDQLGRHWSEEEFLDYVAGSLSDSQEQELDSHLFQCRTCAARMASFQAAEDSFPEADWEQQRDHFIGALSRSIAEEAAAEKRASWQRASHSCDTLQFRLPSKDRLACAGGSPLLDRDEQEFAAVLFKDPGGSLRFDIDFRSPSLAGTKLEVSIGNCTKTIILYRADDEHCAGHAEFSTAECQEMAEKNFAVRLVE